jgi:hypothetical protein
MSVGVYKAKQDWQDRMLASKHTGQELRFVLCVAQFAFGDKIESWPTTEDIMEAGGFSSSGHFKDFRDALVRSGAISAHLGYHTKGAKTPNYKYTMNLDWDGSVAPKGKSGSTSGDCHSTSGDFGSTSGASNTTSNTTKKTSKKDNKSATAPVDPSLPEILPTEKDAVPSSLLPEPSEAVVSETPPGKGESDAVLESRTAQDWRTLRKVRPLTDEERDFLNRRSNQVRADRRVLVAAPEGEDTW